MQLPVGNKIDCTKRKVSESVIKQLLPSQSDMPYLVSAKENIGIEEVSLYMQLPRDSARGMDITIFFSTGFYFIYCTSYEKGCNR